MTSVLAYSWPDLCLPCLQQPGAAPAVAQIQALLPCSCMPGWALSVGVIVPATSSGGPLAASIIVTVPSAWTEDMITSLPQVS